MRFQFLVSLLLAPLTAGCLVEPRDDEYEPNDRPEQATVLSAGQALRARAVEDDLDVFAVDVEAGRRLVLELRHQDGDCCAGFELVDPGGRILVRTDDGCPLVTRPEVLAEGASFEAAALRNDFVLEVEATVAGRYLLTIDEGRTADGLGTFFWDFEILARVL